MLLNNFFVMSLTRAIWLLLEAERTEASADLQLSEVFCYSKIPKKPEYSCVLQCLRHGFFSLPY